MRVRFARRSFGTLAGPDTRRDPLARIASRDARVETNSKSSVTRLFHTAPALVPLPPNRSPCVRVLEIFFDEKDLNLQNPTTLCRPRDGGIRCDAVGVYLRHTVRRVRILLCDPSGLKTKEVNNGSMGHGIEPKRNEEKRRVEFPRAT